MCYSRVTPEIGGSILATERLTQAWVNAAEYDPEKGRQEICDTVVPGLSLWINKTSKSYYLRYRVKATGRQRNLKLGRTTVLSLAHARQTAQELLAEIELGEDPVTWKEPEMDGMFLKELLEEHYYPHVFGHLRSAKEIKRMISTTFPSLLNRPVSDISMQEVEKILLHWKKKGNRGATLNRKLVALKTALNWGVKQGILTGNPLSKLSRRPEKDSTPKLRYLTIEEEDRLYKTLHSRDEALRKARQNHIAWHIERGMPPPPPILGIYADHLEPLITVSLKTGIRRGALFGLEWRDVDFEHRVLVIRGEICKTGKGRVVPLSETALETIRKWKEQSQGEGLIFPSPKTGKRMDNVDSSWERVLREANIKGFRWHDLRHTFASRLVMKGIDLNVVRELLGHSDLKMTLRYAHLAPNIKSRAVELLG